MLVGAGSLGSALLRNHEFEMYGLKIVAAFDVKRSLIHKQVGGIEVFSSVQLRRYCLRHNIQIGIVTVPPDAAQMVADQLVEGGIRAIWNFAHVHLHVPEGVLVQNEDMAVSFALLSSRLACELRREQETEKIMPRVSSESRASSQSPYNCWSFRRSAR